MSLGLKYVNLGIKVWTLLNFQFLYGKKYSKPYFGPFLVNKCPKMVRVSVLTPLISLDWHCSLGLKFETFGIKVSLSVSNIRHCILNNQSWSRYSLVQKSKSKSPKCDKIIQTVTTKGKLWLNVTTCDKMYQNTKRAHRNYSSNEPPEWTGQTKKVHQ